MNLPLATWEPKSERTFVDDDDLESLTNMTFWLCLKCTLGGALFGAAATVAFFLFK